MAKAPAVPRSTHIAKQVRDLRATRQAYLDAAAEIATALQAMGAAVDGPMSRQGHGTRPSLGTRPPGGIPPGLLSATERKIIRHICAGKTEDGAARVMRRSFHTVHVHVKNVYRKLGIHSRRELREMMLPGAAKRQ